MTDQTVPKINEKSDALVCDAPFMFKYKFVYFCLKMGIMHTEHLVHHGVNGNQTERDFVIRLLDDSARYAMSCPTPIACMRNHGFMFLVRGEVLVEAEQDQLLVSANECLTIPAETPFRIRYFRNCSGFMGSFSTDFLCTNPLVTNSFRGFSFMQAHAGYVAQFDHSRSSFIQMLLERIYNETLSVPCNDDVIRANLNSFLVEMAVGNNKTAAVPSRNVLCNRFMEMVFETGQKKMSVAEYADKLNVTANHLNKTVKQNTNKPVSYWIDESLMLAAKMMLKNTSLTMTQISDSLGITDPSYFARRFRHHEQMTPSEYRKIVKADNHG